MRAVWLRRAAPVLLVCLILALNYGTCSADDEVMSEIIRDIEAQEREIEELAQQVLHDERNAKEAERFAQAAYDNAAQDSAAPQAHTAAENKPASPVKDTTSRLHDASTHRSKDRMPPKAKRNPYGDAFATGSTTAPPPDVRRTASPLSGRATTMQQELEEMLASDLLKYTQANDKGSSGEAKAAAATANKLVGRKFARPVEQLIHRFDQRATHYQMLGVRQGAPPDDIKQAYRNLALSVHPDKNPHPDAKAAFAAIQGSYDALINPSARISYDNALNRRPPAIKRWMRKASNNIENAYARSLLFFKRVRTGEWQIELSELTAVVGALLSKIGAMVRKIVRQPTTADRFHLVGEMAWDNKLKLAAAVAVGSVFAGRRR